MQGLGNDFVVIDAISHPIALSAAQYRFLGDRRFGIGCDQILLVEKPTIPEADFRYRIFNNSGEEVEQCGNGARCFARFVHEQGLTEKTEIAVETAGGIIYPRLEDNGQVTVNMGAPCFAPEEIPFIAAAQAPTYDINVAGHDYQFNVLSMGNPHAVQFVADVDQAPVGTLGPLIEHHPRFPRKVNAGFVEVLTRDHIRLRVFERGAGETLACGTGACAAVVAGIQRRLLDDTVSVDTRGGNLTITWQGPGYPVRMTGPAVTVFHGEIVL